MRILPPRLVLIFVIAMGILRITLPGPTVITSPFTWLGMVPICAGLALSVSGARLFRTIGTNIVTFDDPTKLVTGGVFRWSRNPMYLGFVTFLIGFGIVLGTMFPILAPLLFAVIVDRWYIRFEEKSMYRKFGEAYTAYAGRTRRWL